MVCYPKKFYCIHWQKDCEGSPFLRQNLVQLKRFIAFVRTLEYTKIIIDRGGIQP